MQAGAGIYGITGPVAEAGFFGYAKAGQTGAGLHMRLRARAFAFFHGGRHFAICVADLGQVTSAVYEAVAAQLAAEDATSVYSIQNLMLSATHTHCTPGGLSYYALYNQHPPLRGFDKQNWNVVVTGIVEAVRRAHHNMRDCHIRQVPRTLL